MKCKYLYLIAAVLAIIMMGSVVCTSAMAGAINYSTAEDEPACVYEAVFLDNQEITDLFARVRGENAPYPIVTRDFHVTTAFLPAEPHPQWYGSRVFITITAYKAQEVTADDGTATGNEGFKVTLAAENPELQRYLTSFDKNFHITGSYADQAKYTEQVDFSDGMPLEITVIGRYGCFRSDGALYFGE